MHTLTHHYFKDKHACLGPQRREGISSGNSFIHWGRWLLRYWLRCSYHKNLLGRKVGGTFSSAVLPALHVGELVTVTSFFRLWLLLGKRLNRGKTTSTTSGELVDCNFSTLVEQRAWLTSVTTTRLQLGTLLSLGTYQDLQQSSEEEINLKMRKRYC